MSKMYLTRLIGFCLMISVSVASIADATGIHSGEYRIAAAVDETVLTGTATEIWARAYWPENLSSTVSLPVAFFLHGNHSTCGTDTGSFPRIDDSCEYTYTGSCPDGKSVVRNHDGYEYLASQLVDKGFLVISINANRGITCNSGPSGDLGLNLARGRLILKHISLWREWAKSGLPADISQMLKVEPTAFVDRLDFQRVGLLGHSRGGEGVRAAYNLLGDTDSPWSAIMPDVRLKGLFEIGGVDNQTSRVLDADLVAWNQLIPMCDGDVADFQGRAPFERMLAKLPTAKAVGGASGASGTDLRFPKSITGVYGANHNYFNTQWEESDSDSCYAHEPLFLNVKNQSELRSGMVPQQKVAARLVSDFFTSYVKSDPRSLEAILSRTFNSFFAFDGSQIDSSTKVQRENYLLPDVKQADPFLQTTALITDFSMLEMPVAEVNVAGPPSAPLAAVSGISFISEAAAKAISIQVSRPGIVVSWIGSGDDLGIDIDLSQVDVSAAASIDLRISRVVDANGDESRDKKLLNPNCRLQVIDKLGQKSSMILLSEQQDIFGPGSAANQTFHTVRLQLAKFTGINISHGLRSLRLVFNHSGEPGTSSNQFAIHEVLLSPMLAWDEQTSMKAAQHASRQEAALNAPLRDFFERAVGLVGSGNVHVFELISGRNANRIPVPSKVGLSRKSVDRPQDPRAVFSARVQQVIPVKDAEADGTGNREFVDVYVQPLTGLFPVSASLPRLVIQSAGQQRGQAQEMVFTNGRFAGNGKLQTMIFRVSKSALRELHQEHVSLQALPAKMIIGHGARAKVWKVGLINLE